MAEENAEVQDNTNTSKETDATESQTETTNTETKPEGDGNAEAQSKETESTESVVPEKYELKLPENSMLQEARLEDVAAFAKENKLSQDQAQALVDRENKAVQNFADNQKSEVSAKIDAWKEAVSTDKEMGGEKFKENMELSHRVLDRFAPPEFVEMLKETGMGNHPGLVKTMYQIGKQMSDDQLVIGDSQDGGQKLTREEILYPSMRKTN